MTLRFRRSFILVLPFAALTLPTALAGDSVPGATPDPRTGPASAGGILEAEIATPTAPVTLDGVTLFKVRGVSAYPAEQRAGAIAGRIRDIAANPAVSTETLRVIEAEHGSEIRGVDQLLTMVLDADARLEGVERPLLAEAYKRRIASAITAYRQDRSARVLLASTGYSLGATLLLGIILLLLRRLYRRLDAAMERRSARMAS